MKNTNAKIRMLGGETVFRVKDALFGRTDWKAEDLVRLLVVTALLSMSLILVFSSYGYYRIFSNYVVATSEKEAAWHGEVLIERYSRDLVHEERSPGPVLSVAPRDLARIDVELQRYIKTFNLFRIKIYDSEQRVVYGTESKITGMIDSGNIRLKNALAGNLDSLLVTGRRIQDLSEEKVIDVDVVETYVPIRDIDGKPIGVFEIYMNVTRYRDDLFRHVLIAVGILFGVTAGAYGFSYFLIRKGANRLKEFERKLEIMAVTDRMTGLVNRGYLIERGEKEFQRMMRKRERERERDVGQASLGCIMIDIDNFKRVNDTRGHLAGDDVIREVARRFRQTMRPYDVVGRYGGEEFVALMPDSSFEDTRSAAQRVWHSIRSEPFATDEGPINVTISLGVSTFREHDANLNDMLKRADQGMYMAKQNGRDRVESIIDA